MRTLTEILLIVLASLAGQFNVQAESHEGVHNLVKVDINAAAFNYRLALESSNDGR